MMTALMAPEGWVAVPGATIIRERHENKSNTRDQTDERLETEQVHQLGNISHEVCIYTITHTCQLPGSLHPPTTSRISYFRNRRSQRHRKSSCSIILSTVKCLRSLKEGIKKPVSMSVTSLRCRSNVKSCITALSLTSFLRLPHSLLI